MLFIERESKNKIWNLAEIQQFIIACVMFCGHAVAFSLRINSSRYKPKFFRLTKNVFSEFYFHFRIRSIFYFSVLRYIFSQNLSNHFSFRVFIQFWGRIRQEAFLRIFPFSLNNEFRMIFPLNRSFKFPSNSFFSYLESRLHFQKQIACSEFSMNSPDKT